MPRCRCLVLDHDDTVVNSTAAIHYPAFMEALEQNRPGLKLTLEDYFRYNFDPGFSALCSRILAFTPEEMALQDRTWRRRAAAQIPAAYPGLKELLWKFRETGGRICVSSHSLEENIRRDYRVNGLPEPELVVGWDVLPERRKPAPYALEEAMRCFSLPPEALLMVDDLKPGLDMAACCGVPFAAAGWGHCIPEIQAYFRDAGVPYCGQISDLAALLIGD